MQAGSSTEVSVDPEASCSTTLADCICHTPRPNSVMVSVSVAIW